MTMKLLLALLLIGCSSVKRLPDDPAAYPPRMEGPVFHLTEALKNAKDGETVYIPPGTHSLDKMIELSGRKNLTLVGEEGAVINGGMRPGTSPACLKFERAQNLTLRNINLQNCLGAGVFVVSSDGLTVQNTHIHHTRTNLLTGNTKHITIEGSYFHDSLGNHSVSLAEMGSDYVIRRNIFENAPSSALHVNCNPGGCVDVLIEENQMLSGGNAGMNLAGITNAVIRNNRLTGNAKQGIALFDGGNPKYPCKDILIEGNRIEMKSGARACMNSSAKGNRDIRVVGNTCTGAREFDLKYGLSK